MKFTQKQLEIVLKISNKLDYFKEQIEKIDYIHDKYSFFEVMRDFRKYLVKIDIDNNYDIFKHSEKFEYYKEFFSRVNEYYVRGIESMQALSVMTKGIHNFNSITEILDTDYMKDSFIRKSEELSFLNFDNIKNLVVAGSGPFPETLLYLYENTSVENLIGLDYNHEAIYMSGEMIGGLNINKITLKQIDATKYDYKDTDIISIPIFVGVKDDIIRQIEKTGKKTVQILVTIPKGFINLLYTGIEKNNNRLKISNKKQSKTKYINQEIIKLEKYNF